ncbi:MAG: hypothetical protein HNEKOMLI_00303 [Sodalis sp. Psp]|nr:hypothetical protein [Sodalis sp. Psp]MCR3756798.1 hypothetical protein [Sodalis sp. Ppy]
MIPLNIRGLLLCVDRLLCIVVHITHTYTHYDQSIVYSMIALSVAGRHRIA